MENAGDAKQVKERRDKAKKDALLRETGLKTLMGTSEGRMWMWWLLGMCGVYHLSFVPGNGDQTAFNEGARNIGLRLLAEIHRLCPELYGRMQSENQKTKE
jgi:hypothetical protein